MTDGHHKFGWLGVAILGREAGYILNECFWETLTLFCPVLPPPPPPEDMVHPANEINTSSCRVSIYMFVPSTSENPKDNLRKIAIERESSADVEIYSWKQVNGEYLFGILK